MKVLIILCNPWDLSGKILEDMIQKTLRLHDSRISKIVTFYWLSVIQEKKELRIPLFD